MESIEIIFKFSHVLLVEFAAVALQLHLMHCLLQLFDPALHRTHVSPSLQFLVIVFDYGQLVLDLLIDAHQ